MHKIELVTDNFEVPPPSIDTIRLEHGIDAVWLRFNASQAFTHSDEFSDAVKINSVERVTEHINAKIEFGLRALDYITSLSQELPDEKNLRSNLRVDPHVKPEDTDRYFLVGVYDENPCYSVLERAYRPLLEKTIGQRLRTILIEEEPLLLAAKPEETPEADQQMLRALKTSLRQQIENRHNVNLEQDHRQPYGSVAYNEWQRLAHAVEEDPPLLKSNANKQAITSETREQLRLRAASYLEKVPTGKPRGIYGMLSEACTYVASGTGNLNDFITDIFSRTDRYSDDEYVDIVDLLDIYAASLNKIERQQFCKRITDSVGRNSGISVHGQLANTKSILDNINNNLQNPASEGAEFVPKKDGEERVVFQHDGGEILHGRMLINLPEGYDFGSRIQDDEDAGSILLQDSNLDKSVIVPGFTSDAKISEGLFISPADRDPYDISVTSVDPIKVRLLAELYQAAGLSKLAAQLTELAGHNNNPRLDLIVESIQLYTTYDAVIGWSGGLFDITKLAKYGLVKSGNLAGNCTVSAQVLQTSLKVLGLRDVNVVGGIPLTNDGGVVPLHEQVIFKDAHDKAYIADATGEQLPVAVRKHRALQLASKIITIYSIDGSNSLAPETSSAQISNSEKMQQALVEAQEHVLSVALLFAKSTVNGPKREMQFNALGQLPDEHVLVELHQTLYDAPNVSPAELLIKLNEHLAKYDQWLESAPANSESSFSEPVERFREEAAVRQAAKSLYGGAADNLHYLRKIIFDLRAKLLNHI